MQNSPDGNYPKLNLSPFKEDEISGRRVLLIGFYVSIIILFLFRFYHFSSDMSVMGQWAGMGEELDRKIAEFYTQQKILAWVSFIIGASLPAVFLIRRRPFSKITRGLSVVLFLPSVLFATRFMSDGDSASNMVLSMSIVPTIWGKLYLAAQICCVIGIIKLRRKEKELAAEPTGSNSMDH